MASGRRCNAWATFYMKAIHVKYLRPRKRALLKQRWLKARLGLALEGYGSLDLELAAMLGETYMGTHRNHKVLVHTACCRKIQVNVQLGPNCTLILVGRGHGVTSKRRVGHKLLRFTNTNLFVDT